jgi:hypothetical protein
MNEGSEAELVEGFDFLTTTTHDLIVVVVIMIILNSFKVANAAPHKQLYFLFSLLFFC